MPVWAALLGPGKLTAVDFLNTRAKNGKNQLFMK
jgi:hypothetical protein